MTEQFKVSIIVPVYNVEHYIADTLASLISQTYLNWEAIVVDDGSTDKSLDICSQYASIDARIQVFSKPNGGLSDARNYGLTKASGDLFGFLDGDDTLHPQFLEWMVKPFQQMDIDITGCEFGYDLTTYERMNDPSIHELSRNETIQRYLINDRYCEESVCNKLFRSILFENLRFPLGKIHEDTFVLMTLLVKSNGYAFVDFKGYNVVSRAGSITRSNYTLKEYDKVEACLDILDRSKGKPYWKLAFNKYLGTLLWFILKTNGRNNNSIAYDALKAIPLKNYRFANLRFIPFLLAYRCRLLPYIKVK